MSKKALTLLEGTLSQLKKSGVSYADGRVVEKEEEHLLVKNQEMDAHNYKTESGAGIRVLHKGAWGFAATRELTEKSLKQCAHDAFEIAKASAICAKEKVKLSQEEIHKAVYATPYEKDPFEIPTEEKISLLLRASKNLKGKFIKTSSCFLDFYKTKKYFASTEGARIEQNIMESGGGMEAYAVHNGDVQKRSYPNSLGGNMLTGGYEIIERFNLPAHSGRLKNEAEALLKANPCPSGEFDLILMPPQLCLQVHESCGHAVEADRVFGMEISLAGGTFLMPEKKGKFRYGSRHVNITADTELKNGLGTFGYDDEGVKGRKVNVISEGVFNGYLSSRETAAKLKTWSSGAMRAESWNRIPLIRMVNVYLEPGGAELEELIATTKRGLLMDVNKSWSIDDYRLNFQFGCEAAWEIKNGRVGQMFKNPVYYGMTPKFWNACDAVCSQKYFQVIGVPNCGKGVPGQTMHVGHGAAPARFRKIKIGHV